MNKSTLYLLLLALLPLLLVGSFALRRGVVITGTSASEQDAHTEALRQEAREAAATAKLVDDSHRETEEKVEEIRRKTAQHISELKWARGETPTSQESRDAVGIKRD